MLKRNNKILWCKINTNALLLAAQLTKNASQRLKIVPRLFQEIVQYAVYMVIINMLIN